MKINQSFTISKPLPVVWALFENVPEMASCMPGAQLGEDKGEGLYTGQVRVRLGPFNAAFEGEAKIAQDSENRSGRVEGKGTDRRGGSRSKLVLDYRLMESNGVTTVTIDADVQLSGPVAQFGRTSMISETANAFIGQFVTNVESRLKEEGKAREPSSSSPQVIRVTTLIWQILKSLLRGLFVRS
jgi:carbon monoxide dehydrogenase subunit G